MESFNGLLAVIRDDLAAQEWEGACASLQVALEKLNSDAKAMLVDRCTPALVHAIERHESGEDACGGAATLASACAALNALVTGLPAGAKQSALRVEKGIVPALLRVLGDENGKAAWGHACFALGDLVDGLPADATESMLGDGHGIVEAIAGVLESDQADAFAAAGVALGKVLSGLPAATKQTLLCDEKGIVRRLLSVIGDSRGKASSGDPHGAMRSIHLFLRDACRTLNSFLRDLPPSSKSLPLSQSQLVATIISVLESEDAHSCWAVAMELLKRLAFQDASLSHINFGTLEFLEKDCGLMAVLLRCSDGFNIEADSKCFKSACSALVPLSLTNSVKPTVCSRFAQRF